MNRFFAVAFALLIISSSFSAAPGEPAEPQSRRNELLNSVTWVKGPGKVSIGNIANVEVPAGFQFTAAQGTQKLLKEMGNPTSGDELGFLAPTSLDWFVIFEFSDVGFIKDDDKDKLNPDKMLKSIRQGTEEANKIREKMGSSPMKIVGWEYPPKYNEQTHNLEWAIRGESDGDAVVNYNTRLLGRKGVMEANLVIDPDKLSATLPVFQGLLQNYSYKTGESYSEYRQGDKLAKYGLAALVTGGAAAVAVKTGLFSAIILFFKKGAKLIIFAAVAVGAFIKKLFTRKSDHEMQ